MADPQPPPLLPSGDYSKPPELPTDQPSSLHWIVPVETSGLAIIAGYLGLFAILGVFAPFALLFGILALRDINANPKKHGRGRAIFGIVMGVIGSLILLSILGTRL